MDKTNPPVKQPTVRKSRGISIIWTLPLLALAICGWLLFESIQNAGIEITVYFNDARGITASKTQVMLRGIPVGLVEKVDPDVDNNRVKAIIKMDKGLADHLVSDTLFWIVKPEISATSVQGLETIISGSYIAIRPGSSTTQKKEFTALRESPAVDDEAPGLHITLTADELGSIQKDTGIYFKNIQIGSVQSYRLAVDNSILINTYIEPKYAGLVRTGSRFYNASGLTISGKLPDLSVKIESLASLLRGGILVYTPKELNDTPQAKNGQSYQLYRDLEAASFGIPMTLQLASGADIVEGKTKLKYRGIEAGFVKEITINDDERKTVTAHVLLDPRAELILRENTVFWLVKPSISPNGVQNLRTLITGSHITFQPGDGEFKNHFTILPEPPTHDPLRNGTYFRLRSADGVNLSPGAPVYFKDIKVGEVTDIGFAGKSTDLVTTIFIYDSYEHFINVNSIFWIASGVEISADFSGIDLSTGPLARMLSGGIVFSTPDLQEIDTQPASEEMHFTLFANYKAAVEANEVLQPKGLQLQLLSESAGALGIGTPVLHKQLQIGKVTGVSFGKQKDTVLIDCFIEEKYQSLINDTTKFYTISGFDISGGLDDIKLRVGPLESLFKGGVGFVTPGSGTSQSKKSPYRLYSDIDDALHADDAEITVTFNDIGSLKKGSPLRYKGVKVGEISDIGFGKDTNTVKVKVRVDDIVAPLFRTTTRIWRVQPKISLSGVSNLDTAVFGSHLTFAPGAGQPTYVFTGLKKAPQMPFAEKEGFPLILESTHLGSLTTGSPLYYRELQIGEVTGFELSPSFQQVYIFTVIKPEYAAIVRENTKFWNISGAKVKGGLLSGLTLSTGSFQSILRGGIALATPNNADAGDKVKRGQRFTLHDSAEKEWLDWNPDIVLIGE